MMHIEIKENTMLFPKIVLAVLALTLAGCSSVQSRIERNNEFAVAKVNNACEALSAFPERYARCMAGEEQPFLDCYEKKIVARVMPSEALAICRAAVDSRGKVEPPISANPRNGDEQFGIEQPEQQYRSYGNRGYGRSGNREYGYRDGYSYGNQYGYSGGDWPRLSSDPNRIPGIQIIQGPPQRYMPPVQIQTAPTYIAPIPGQVEYNYKRGPL